MSPRPPAETLTILGCSVVLRRVEGPFAVELFLSCHPPPDMPGSRQQAEAIYRALIEVLEAAGGGYHSVVTETVFIRDLASNIAATREARHQVLTEHDSNWRPAINEIGQPPLAADAWVALAAQAVLPNSGSQSSFDTVTYTAACDCAECANTHGVRVILGDEVRLYAAGLCGRGGSAREQTLAMFTLAEQLLQAAEMTFSDVTRAWIHLREMDRDYPQLNRARREFFRARAIDPVPASTGIGGGPVGDQHDLSLGIYAVKSAAAPSRTVMTSPTLNEAGEYGADFVRGLRVREINRDALHLSGTASIDEHGNTAHVGDFDAQAERMLVNIAALLARQGASFDDIVSAITYLRDPEDAERLRLKLEQSGFRGFPNVFVHARVCRPELLCEIESLAVLPLPGTSKTASG